MAMPDLIRCLTHVFTDGPITLSLWDTGRTDDRGCSILGYELQHRDWIVFNGEDFAGSPMHADDSDECVACLLRFLSLRPGDTDQDYFAGYSSEQLDWAIAHGEELAMLAEDPRWKRTGEGD